MSGLLQDSLLVVQDMQFDAVSQSFIAIFSRFMWEAAPGMDPQDVVPEMPTSSATPKAVATKGDEDARFEDVPADDQTAYFRVHCAFRVEGVGAAKTQRLPNDRKANLNLLSVTQPDPQSLLLTFSEGAAIRLTVTGLKAALEDLGEPWPTLYRPDHALSETQAH